LDAIGVQWGFESRRIALLKQGQTLDWEFDIAKFKDEVISTIPIG
jgi:hypothetical protein